MTKEYPTEFNGIPIKGRESTFNETMIIKYTSSQLNNLKSKGDLVNNKIVC